MPVDVAASSGDSEGSDRPRPLLAVVHVAQAKKLKDRSTSGESTTVVKGIRYSYRLELDAPAGKSFTQETRLLRTRSRNPSFVMSESQAQAPP